MNSLTTLLKQLTKHVNIALRYKISINNTNHWENRILKSTHKLYSR